MDMFFFPEIMRRLIGAKARISGVFARAEGIGYFFHLGVNMRSMEEYCAKVRKMYGIEITPLFFVRRKSARLIMSATHNLNNLENLPGVVKFINPPKARAA
jgi:hypothetical protein